MYGQLASGAAGLATAMRAGGGQGVNQQSVAGFSRPKQPAVGGGTNLGGPGPIAPGSYPSAPAPVAPGQPQTTDMWPDATLQQSLEQDYQQGGYTPSPSPGVFPEPGTAPVSGSFTGDTGASGGGDYSY